MTDFWRLFLGFFFKSVFGDVARCRASEGPAAVVRRMGGGIPLDIPGEGIERKFHTPAPWRGGFKSHRRLPLAPTKMLKNGPIQS